MQFIEDIQIREWCVEHGVSHGERGEIELPDESLVLRRGYGQAVRPEGHEDEVSAICVETLGVWEECLLWVKGWGIWPSSEDWPAFYKMRGEEGERRSLDTTPGHLFRAGEAPLLARFLQLVLENAWDAEVLASLGGQITGRINVSHDEWVEVWRSTR